MSGAAQAAVVVNGVTFQKISNGTGNGQMNLTGGTSLRVTGGSGDATNDTQSVYVQVPQVTLGVGETFSFRFTLTDLNTVATAAGVRIALGNMPVSVGDVATPNPNWASGTRDGYLLWIPTTGTSVAGSGDIVFRKYTGLQNPLSGSGSSNVQLGSAVGAFSLANGTQETEVFFEVTRTTLTTIQLSGKVGSHVLSVTSDSDSPFFAFNTIQLGLRNYNDGRGFELELPAAVPEPGSVALLGISCGVIVWALRRQRGKA